MAAIAVATSAAVLLRMAAAAAEVTAALIQMAAAAKDAAKGAAKDATKDATKDAAMAAAVQIRPTHGLDRGEVRDLLQWARTRANA